MKHLPPRWPPQILGVDRDNPLISNHISCYISLQPIIIFQQNVFLSIESKMGSDNTVHHPNQQAFSQEFRHYRDSSILKRVRRFRMKHQAQQKKRQFMDHITQVHDDILAKRYQKPTVVSQAQALLSTDGEISEEIFLGAQGVLFLNGML
jgi:hypothetical protein